ncbi:MAG: hypothetical protein ACI9GW_001857 [Halieaceae bacterium]|jgi:uncharacterized protein
MHVLLAALALHVLVSVSALAEPSFPALSGRVVDNANVLSARAESSLTALLEAHENATGNQLVVATLEDIQGYDIADYGYQLGRHWDIGQKDKNNGALLILASKERKVRIEVGYGLEGQLTDAVSSNIISTVILPRFRSGDFETGLLQGTQAMIQAVGGEYQMRSAQKSRSKNKISAPGVVVLGFFLLQFLGGLLPGRRLGRRRGLMFIPMGMGGGGRSSGGFGGGGGFSGGGGSFGGGGASGGW